MTDAKTALLALNVSRETMVRLEKYAELLKKWNPTINLVGKSTIKDLWQRHIHDSAQLYQLAPQGFSHWLDIGSGGGFPGLVVAIMAHEENPQAKITLVESDQRKCAFLRTVLRETGVAGNVISQRIEVQPPLGCDVVSARALADLNVLCSFAERHLETGGIALFQKGATWEKELRAAQESWSFDHQVITSKTESSAVILKIKRLTRD